jgi:hypothetical protein
VRSARVSTRWTGGASIRGAPHKIRTCGLRLRRREKSLILRQNAKLRPALRLKIPREVRIVPQGAPTKRTNRNRLVLPSSSRERRRRRSSSPPPPGEGSCGWVLDIGASVLMVTPAMDRNARFRHREEDRRHLEFDSLVNASLDLASKASVLKTVEILIAHDRRIIAAQSISRARRAARVLLLAPRPHPARPRAMRRTKQKAATATSPPGADDGPPTGGSSSWGALVRSWTKAAPLGGQEHLVQNWTECRRRRRTGNAFQLGAS